MHDAWKCSHIILHCPNISAESVQNRPNVKYISFSTVRIERHHRVGISRTHIWRHRGGVDLRTTVCRTISVTHSRANQFRVRLVSGHVGWQTHDARSSWQTVGRVSTVIRVLVRSSVSWCVGLSALLDTNETGTREIQRHLSHTRKCTHVLTYTTFRAWKKRNNAEIVDSVVQCGTIHLTLHEACRLYDCVHSTLLIYDDGRCWNSWPLIDNNDILVE